jgi:Ala-tRNA(Pro) deacylase
MPTTALKEFLDSRKIRYEVIPHTEAYTAQYTAAYAHVRGRELAKTVMVKLDGKIGMAVLPSSLKVDFRALKEASGAKKAQLAGEEEFRDLFPGCEVGAMPPFGNLYGMRVFVAESLRGNEKIAFNAGTHVELIRMSYKDFERLVQPEVLRFSIQAA